MSSFEVAVVGLGAVGCSALYALSRNGAKAIGIDRFAPPHDQGSSHGESRITREGIGEGHAYVPLALRSNRILEELEEATGNRLLERCGFLIIQSDGAGTMCHGKLGFMETSLDAARANAIDHEHLDGPELKRRFPQFTGLNGDEQAYFEPSGGYVRPDSIVSTLLALSREKGAKIRTACRVTAIERDGSGFRIRAGDETLLAGSVIVAAGPWISELSPRVAKPHVSVSRQVLHWFPVEDKASYRPGFQPTFYWMHGPSVEQQFYGFPPIDGAVKVAIEQYSERTCPDGVERKVSLEEQRQIAELHVQGRLAGLAPRPSRSKTCLYSLTEDFDFLVGEESLGLHVVSACSGHGFKHAPALGEQIALEALGLPPLISLAGFEASRLCS